MNKGRLIVISGPSGIGKGTVCQRLLNEDDALVYSISVTTRAMRPGDAEGVTYFFVDEAEFQRMVAAGELLEHAGIYGKRYGTPRRFVEETLDSGRDVVLDIETDGAMQIMERLRNRVTTIFLLPPTLAELKRRLFERHSEAPDKAMERFLCAKAEIPLAMQYDFALVNDNLDETVRKLQTIIDVTRFAPQRLQAHINALLEETPL